MSDKAEQQSTNQPGANRPGTTSSTTRGTSGTTPPGKVLGINKRQFVIAPRRMDGMMQAMAFQPMAFDYFEQAVRSSPDIEIVDRIGPKGLVGTLADGMGGAPNILVVRMADDKAEILRQQGRGQLIVERDQPLRLSLTDTHPPEMVTGAVLAGSPEVSTVITVLGHNNSPVKDAEVFLFGSLLTSSGLTDQRGQVTLSLAGETAQSVRGLYVKPKSDYWTFYQAEPALDIHQPNIVYLRALSDSFPDFPRQQVTGWGQRAMRLDQLPGHYRGQGVRIAVVDSGAATTCQDLQGIRFGFDILNKKTDPSTWNQDTVSHGSHCAGIIAGADNAIGIRGFAPDAEVHACKLFPGGQISQLIDALEYCIEKQIDLVNLSLDGSEPSEALEQQILRAKRLGVACIAAAGNTGGAVQYPASSPYVLAVAAIGKLGEFPPDSYHAETVTAIEGAGLYSPKFTCFGPEIGVCGPGVAILSCVPPNNYSVWDGTSMAAAHVTGLAALVLAHHAEFQGPFRARNSDRVDRLFQILKGSAQPVNLGDPRRTGFGLPDVLAALSLAPWPATAGAARANAASPQTFVPLSAGGGWNPGFWGPMGSYGSQGGPWMPFANAPYFFGSYAQPGIYAFGPGGFAPGAFHRPPVLAGAW